MLAALLKPRWVRRFLRPILPGWQDILFADGTVLAVDPADLRGPSFHIGHSYADPESALASYEPEQRAVVETSLLARASGGGAPVFFDIGANVGLFTVSAKRRFPGLRVFAFEPHPRNGACLARTIAANGWAGSVRCEPVALSDSAGEAALFEDESDAGGHSLLEGSMLNNQDPSRSVKVPLVRLDDWAPGVALDRLDFLKMDVQGAEAPVLRGGLATLARFRPEMLIEVQHDRVDELLAALEKLPFRYEVIDLEDGGRGPLARLREWSERKQAAGVVCRDYHFVPERG